MTMTLMTIMAPRILPLFQSRSYGSNFAPSSSQLFWRTRRRRKGRNDSNPDPEPTSARRWMRSWSSGGKGNNGSGSGSGSNTCTSNDTAERRLDHRQCVELVRTRDYEGYLCGLLMPSSAQEGYFALRAFNVEIATIKDAASSTSSFSRRHGSFNNNNMDENIGEADPSFASRLRMRWWADAISEIFDDVTMEVDGEESNNPLTTSQSSPLSSLQRRSSGGLHNNPTLRSLRRAVHEHQLTHRFLRRMAEAREFDLDVVQHDRLRDVAQYGEDTVSNMLYSTLECVGVRDEATDEVASDIGVSLGILTALRSTGFRATRGECSIPRDLTIKHSVTMDTLWKALNSSLNPDSNTTTETLSSSQASLRNATVEMVDRATFHLQRARSKQSVVPKEARMCLLPAVCGMHYLSSLKECNYDVLHRSLVGLGGDSGGNSSQLERRRRLNLMFLLGRTWLTGTF